MASIPSESDPKWRDIATGKVSKPWKLLAVKIMMARITALTKSDPSPDTLRKCIQEMHSFFTKNAVIAKDDLTAMFG